MKRFFGMMPSDEIEREEGYLDKYNHKIIIQAGPNGWSILYADGSSQYKDETKSTDDNFKEAYENATKSLGELKKHTTDQVVEVLEG